MTLISYEISKLKINLRKEQKQKQKISSRILSIFSSLDPAYTFTPGKTHTTRCI